MDTPANRPEFVLMPTASTDAAEMLLEIEQAITTDPQLMGDAFLYEVARRDPRNLDKSPAELMALAKVTSPLDSINAVVGMWRDYEDKELWRSVEGFDDTTESIIAADPTFKSLLDKLRNPANRHKEETQRTIRNTRVALYIGRVLAARSQS